MTLQSGFDTEITNYPETMAKGIWVVLCKLWYWYTCIFLYWPVKGAKLEWKINLLSGLDSELKEAKEAAVNSFATIRHISMLLRRLGGGGVCYKLGNSTFENHLASVTVGGTWL